MYPHERSLVKKFENKPFVLLGVNSDPDRDELKSVLEKEEITWRSWWDGGSTNGPIATRWNVSGWPTIYLIDAAGIIRHKNVRGNDLDAALDALVAEAEESAAAEASGAAKDR